MAAFVGFGGLALSAYFVVGMSVGMSTGPSAGGNVIIAIMAAPALIGLVVAGAIAAYCWRPRS